MTQPQVLRSDGREVIQRFAPNRLGLLDEHVARGVSHFDPLVVVYHGVMDPRGRTNQLGLLRRGTLHIHVIHTWHRVVRVGGSVFFNNDKFLPAAESVIHFYVVDREGGNRERHARVEREPKRQRHLEEAAGAHIFRFGGGVGRHRVSSLFESCHRVDVPDHVSVAH